MQNETATNPNAFVNTSLIQNKTLILITSNLKTQHTMDKQTYQERKEKYLGWISQLACSQGFYGRLLEELEENEEALKVLCQEDFKDAVDMVLWLES